MKKSSDYSGQFIVSQHASVLVLLREKNNRHKERCYYVSPDFSKLRRHKKFGYDPLNPKIEWKWAVDTWGTKATDLSSVQIESILYAIKNKLRDNSKPVFKSNSLVENQSLVALRISMIK